MAESILKIYNTNITLDKNVLVENIETYLAALTPTLQREHFQYQKIDLDLFIKIDLSQEYVGKEIGNYVDIYQDNKHWYYFIISSSWTATNTIQLQLSIDSVNTFKLGTDYTFNDKTNIIREHKNLYTDESKFNSNTVITLHKKIDKTNEGVSGVATIRKSRTAINAVGKANQNGI